MRRLIILFLTVLIGFTSCKEDKKFTDFKTNNRIYLNHKLQLLAYKKIY
jgi:hypothetical protein